MNYTQHHTQDIHIFIGSLYSIYLQHNHIQHPSSQHYYPYKLFIAIVNQITSSTHKITIEKIKAHTCIIGYEIVDHLANDASPYTNPPTSPQMHKIHTMLYWLNRVLTCTYTGAILNLQAYINKEHMKQSIFEVYRQIDI